MRILPGLVFVCSLLGCAAAPRGAEARSPVASSDPKRTETLTIAGRVGLINETLVSLVFTPAPDRNGTIPLTMTTSDQGNSGAGGALTDTDTIAITLAPVNDAPRFTIPDDRAIVQVWEDSGPQVIPGYAIDIAPGWAPPLAPAPPWLQRVTPRSSTAEKNGSQLGEL